MPIKGVWERERVRIEIRRGVLYSAAISEFRSKLVNQKTRAKTKAVNEGEVETEKGV